MLDDCFHIIVYEQFGFTILVPNVILLKTSWKVSLMHQSWPSCSRCDILRRNALLISGSMRCFVTWLYFICCTSWMCSVCGSWYIYIVQVDGYLLAVEVYVQYEEVKCCVLSHQWLRLMVFCNVYNGFDLLPVGGHGCCKTSGNSGEPYGLSFALLGCRTSLQWSSWYLLAKMMLASAPEPTFMVYRCPLILVVTIVLGYSCQSFAKFLCDTLFGSFNWRSTDPQTFPKCTFCYKYYRWHCGICSDLCVILSPHNTYKFWSFSLFVYFLKSFPP